MYKSTVTCVRLQSRHWEIHQLKIYRDTTRVHYFIRRKPDQAGELSGDSNCRCNNENRSRREHEISFSSAYPPIQAIPIIQASASERASERARESGGWTTVEDGAGAADTGRQLALSSGRSGAS